MLKEIKCDIFNEKVVNFYKGLNVVIGDKKASNSIGKSTFLMIIDFVFGGNSYIDKNKDVVTNIREHEFYFSFEFDEELYNFKRSTNESKYVDKCDNEYKVVERLSIEQYTELLKNKYNVGVEYISFRGVVSLYSRIWQKGNFDVKRPLHELGSIKNSDAIISLIKLFNKYKKIFDLEVDIKELGASKTAVQKGEKFNHIPKVTKNIVNKNIKEIERIKAEMEKVALSVSINLNDFATQLNNKLIEEIGIIKRKKNNYEMKLTIIRKNKVNNEKVNSSEFNKLIEFFPTVNIDKLNEINDFHSSIAKVLGEELIKSEADLISKIELLDNRILQLENKINEVVSKQPVSEDFLKPLLELSSQLNQKENENRIYEKKQSLSAEIKETKEKLTLLKTAILVEISDIINKKITEINNDIHTLDRREPKLVLAENTYAYGIEDNTGTGEAFTNLIEFDLAVLELTELPIIIHDSMMFKNIENDVVENLVCFYNKNNKQIFIAIDEVNKYSVECQNILKEKMVLSLSENKLLFIKDWRAKK